MKTAISLPDDLFESADALAERLGLSRSELYATAVAEYLAKHRDEDVTGRLNDVFADETQRYRPGVTSRPGTKCEFGWVVVQRREVWWADLEEPRGSEPGFRRPILVVQADSFNRSRLRTVLGVVLTSNTRLLDAPGNVLLPARNSGLPKDSVGNVTQIVALDEDYLSERTGRLPPKLMAHVDAGLKLVLDL